MGRAEPALIEAQKSVNGIQPSHLQELRSLARPPEMVKYAIEAVITLIQNTTVKPDWNACKEAMKKSDFIKSILAFDKDMVKQSVKNHI